MSTILIQGSPYELTDEKVLRFLHNANSSDKSLRDNAIGYLNLCVFNTIMKDVHNTCRDYTGLAWKDLIRELQERYAATITSMWHGNYCYVTIMMGDGLFESGISAEAKEFQIALCVASLWAWLKNEGTSPVRVTKGVARWKNDFTPPNAPYDESA